MVKLDDIKKAMRISHEALDTDIQRNIDTCLLDLERVGVNSSKESDLITKAAELYCKWQYDYAGKGEQFQKNYEALRNSMSMAEDYKKAETDTAEETEE